MKRFILILLLAMFAVPLLAQDANPDAKTDEEPAEKPAEKADETTEEDVGVPTDYNAYLKQLFPHLDPGGEHDLFNLKNYKEEAKRHPYTVAMAQLLIAYMTELKMGSTISKQFDQYARGAEATQPTFKVLYALVLMYYPPGQPNVSEAEKLLREATEQAKDYAYPWFLLANFEFARFTQSESASPRPVLQALDKALAINPRFVRAVLLKGQVYMQAQPPRVADVRELIEPFVKDKLSTNGDDFEDTLRLYAACHTASEVYELIKSMFDGGKLTNTQKVRAYQVQTGLRISKQEFDQAIDELNRMLTWVTPENDPTATLLAHKRLAEAWSKKAMLIRTEDRELKDPKNKHDFDMYLAGAETQHLKCAEIEAKYLPVALRGTEARQYVEFLYGGKNDPEAALKWLRGYLDETDLTTAQRNILDNFSKLLEIEINPTEEGLIELYEGYVAQDDVQKLARSFAMAKENIRLKGLSRFKLLSSLKFFITQLNNRERLVVSLAAYLVADTARNYFTAKLAEAEEAKLVAQRATAAAEKIVADGGDATEETKQVTDATKLAEEAMKAAKAGLKLAGEAIADRYEKEGELNSDAQAELHKDLCDALVQIGNRASQERGVRQAAKLILAAKENMDIRSLMKGVANVWSDEAFLDGLIFPPTKISKRDLFSPDKIVAWLEKLADALKKEVDAEAK